MATQTKPAPESKSCFDIDLAQLKSFSGDVEADPSKAQFTFKASTEWLGGARARTTARDFTITTDEPNALGGTDSAVDPVELLLASASTCMQIGIVTHAAKRGVDIKDLSVEAEGDLDVRGYLGVADTRPGYNEIRYRVRITADAPEATLREIVNVAEAQSPMLDNIRNGAPVVQKIELTAASTE